MGEQPPLPVCRAARRVLAGVERTLLSAAFDFVVSARAASSRLRQPWTGWPSLPCFSSGSGTSGAPPLRSLQAPALSLSQGRETMPPIVLCVVPRMGMAHPCAVCAHACVYCAGGYHESIPGYFPQECYCGSEEPKAMVELVRPPTACGFTSRFPATS